MMEDDIGELSEGVVEFVNKYFDDDVLIIRELRRLYDRRVNTVRVFEQCFSIGETMNMIKEYDYSWFCNNVFVLKSRQEIIVGMVCLSY